MAEYLKDIYLESPVAVVDGVTAFCTCKFIKTGIEISSSNIVVFGNDGKKYGVLCITSPKDSEPLVLCFDMH
jgi:hypothetical protein